MVLSIQGDEILNLKKEITAWQGEALRAAEVIIGHSIGGHFICFRTSSVIWTRLCAPLASKLGRSHYKWTRPPIFTNCMDLPRPGQTDPCYGPARDKTGSNEAYGQQFGLGWASPIMLPETIMSYKECGAGCVFTVHFESRCNKPLPLDTWSTTNDKVASCWEPRCSR